MTINQFPLFISPNVVTGLQLAWGSNTTLTVAAGSCRDTNNSVNINLTAGVTINAATTGLNGLDTGSLANSTIYAVYVIGNSGENDTTYFSKPAGCLVSTNLTGSPVMPTGYDVLYRIGWAITDGSAHFLTFYQDGTGKERTYKYDSPVSVTTGTATSFTAVDLSPAVPAIATLVTLNAAYTPNTAANSFSLRPTGSSVAAANAPVIATGAVATVAQKFPPFEMQCLVASSKAEIDYVLTSASDALTLKVAGYKDFLA